MLVQSLALAFDALAFLDIQDDLGPAGPAVHWESMRHRLRVHPEQAVIPPAHRTDDPSVLHDKSNSIRSRLQAISPLS